MSTRVLTLIGLLAAAPLGSQDLSGLTEPLVTDRPDFTESTSAVSPGHYQLEGGFTFARIGEEESQSFGELLLRIGVAERWEARLGIGSFSRIDAGVSGADAISGYEDPFVGLKVRLTEETPDQPVVALLLAATVPIGDDELTSDEWEPEAKLAVSWDLNSRVSLASNLGYAYPADGADRFHQWSGSLSAGFSLGERLGMYLEGFGFSKESADGSATRYINTGLTCLLSNDLQLDARVGAGLDDPSPNWFAGIGAAVRF